MRTGKLCGKVGIALVVAGMLFIPMTALGNPFLVCDPQAGVTNYKLTGPGWIPASVTAQADGSLRMDVAEANVGANSLTIKACKTDPVWGEQCTTAVPFIFSRPASPDTPSGIKLIP